MKRHSLILIMLLFAVGCGDSETNNPIVYCDDPAFLEEKPANVNPGYIIYLVDGVELNSELDRLENNYDIEIMNIYDKIGGFSALMSDTTLEQIRCEESIESIYYNEIYWLHKSGQ